MTYYFWCATMLAMIPLYSRVRLKSNRYEQAGLYPGTVGARPGIVGDIIVRYDDGTVEVQGILVDPNGENMIATFVAQESELESVQEPEVESLERSNKGISFV